MIAKKHVLFAVLASFGLAAQLPAEELQPMDAEIAQRYGQHLVEMFTKEIKEPQLKFEGDPTAAVGLHAEEDGILIVPIKDLKEGNVDPAVESETGGGMCYLFMSPCFNPLVDGKPCPAEKLRRLKFTDGEGNEREATCLLVTAKHVDGDDWRLYVFGADKKPLIDSRFGESLENAKGNLAIHVNNAKDHRANLVFTVFNKYSASFDIAHK